MNTKVKQSIAMGFIVVILSWAAGAPHWAFPFMFFTTAFLVLF